MDGAPKGKGMGEFIEYFPFRRGRSWLDCDCQAMPCLGKVVLHQETAKQPLSDPGRHTPSEERSGGCRQQTCISRHLLTSSCPTHLAQSATADANREPWFLPSVMSVQFGGNRCKRKLLMSALWQVKKTAAICPKKQILILNIVRHGFYAQCNLQARQARPAEPRLRPTPAVSPSAMEMPK